ncbi:hypothetical protein PQ469_12075 [Mucilaginibacter sp. KACC 22773]|uniref:hypothetical protein n=1 Tax=Mucilaginibacter sp. KACC 22773 TaxID=3025671 RepID=UPI0023655F73|nr:hypothetical protein [Mucilaginibacter sp. KACC 22773]WDF80744.1 hypothetical protein PQ469_12075 [Mucilaginibacter sp. KACC 22773]
MKKMTIVIFLALAYFSNCNSVSSVKTVNIFIDSHKSGWYFIRLTKDSTSKSDGIGTIKFSDSSRMGYIRIKDINNTKFIPYDYHGNILSERLKLTGVMTASPDGVFFEFYNPTEEELKNIDKWDASNDRAFKIRTNEKIEFDKQRRKF